MTEAESAIGKLDVRAAQSAAECQRLLDAIFHPRSQQAISEMAELRQGGVGEAQIESLYPLTLSDYIRGAQIISDDSRISSILWGSAAMEDVGDVQYRLKFEFAQQIAAQREDPELLGLGSNLGAAIATVQLLTSLPLHDVVDDYLPGKAQERDALAVVHWLEAFQWVLTNLRREQVIISEGDPLRRALLRWRYTWATSSLRAFIQRLRSPTAGA